MKTLKRRRKGHEPIVAEVMVLEERMLLSATCRDVRREERPQEERPVEQSTTPVVQPAVAVAGVWLSEEEIMALPMSGSAWTGLVSAANRSSTPDLSNQDSNDDVYTLAKALVGTRTNNAAMLNSARSQIMRIINTENGGRTLALGRNLTSYVIAADIVGLSPSQETTFKNWLRGVVNERLDGQTLISTMERRPNNWGTHATAALAATAVYLGDTTLLNRVVQVYKGWLGDRSSYAGFSYGDLSWQSNRNAPVGINPKGATISGRNVDGVLPDDQRRGGSFRWPPPKENYVYEALQGAVVTAEILHRKGFDAYNWSDKAILRAYTWLNNVAQFPAEGDDRWQINIINKRYGTNFVTTTSANHGKNMGWTSWTHR